MVKTNGTTHKMPSNKYSIVAASNFLYPRITGFLFIFLLQLKAIKACNPAEEIFVKN